MVVNEKSLEEGREGKMEVRGIVLLGWQKHLSI